MTAQLFNTEKTKEKVILTAIENQKNSHDFDYAIEEFKNLALADNLEVADILTQKYDRPNAATYFGKGKVEELKELVIARDAQLVISNDDLTATQIRNLEKMIGAGVRVVDRTGLILDIFAARAKTRIAKLQVRLAQKQYQLPRLHTSLANDLDQQAGAGGGSFTSRGSGETKLELNRRTIEDQISQIKTELKSLLASSTIQRKQRDNSGLKRVALVGYTNAGKSTWMNRIIEQYSQIVDDLEEKKVFEKDMLFATLDSTVRSVRLPNKRQFLLSDTVGFVSNLPHNLVASFQSTLEEASNADLLVQIVDISDPHYRDMLATTSKTLQQIGAKQIPMITIFNKADKAKLNYPERSGENLIASALDGKSLDAFIDLLNKKLFADLKEVELLIPFDQGSILSQLIQDNQVLRQEYNDKGTKIVVELPEAKIKRYEKFVNV
ncbi:GTPase HflX [Oenococcus sp. UCMA 16435]|nr:GTPase HflX [Oenococcus sp. UCMA 16435]MDI4584406.1 GTPase HflX [Oenococcus sp. UCMA 14587]